MKKKVFIVQYVDVANDNDSSFYIVEAKTNKSALKEAYKQHNPQEGEVEVEDMDDHYDHIDSQIEDDFFDNANVIAVIKNTNIKDVKLV
jgi:hypothetical protein